MVEHGEDDGNASDDLSVPSKDSVDSVRSDSSNQEKETSRSDNPRSSGLMDQETKNWLIESTPMVRPYLHRKVMVRRNSV